MFKRSENVYSFDDIFFRMYSIKCPDYRLLYRVKLEALPLVRPFPVVMDELWNIGIRLTPLLLSFEQHFFNT